MKIKFFIILILCACEGIVAAVKEPLLVKYQASIAMDRCEDGSVSEVTSKGFKCKK